MAQMLIELRKYPASWLETWCYVLVCPETRQSVIIDPGGSAQIVARMAEGTHVQCILISHGHRDHTSGLEELVELIKAPVGVHEADATRLPKAPDFFLRDGETLQVGGLSLQVIHTPGHTPGSTCFLVGKHLIAGDTLFPGGPGRTATPQDLEQIIQSIVQRLYVLPEETVVHPGHGAETTLGKSKEEYAVFAARPHAPGLCGDVLWATS